MIALVVWLCLLTGTCQTAEAEVAYLKHLTREAARDNAREPHTHAAVYRGSGPGVEQWRSLVATYLPADAVETALCLMWFESKGDPNALSYANSRGLMQIHAPSWADHYGVSYDDLYDPATNLSIAADLYRKDGWVHWNPWRRGECR